MQAFHRVAIAQQQRLHLFRGQPIEREFARSPRQQIHRENRRVAGGAEQTSVPANAPIMMKLISL